jgi:hypothetical protein
VSIAHDQIVRKLANAFTQLGAKVGQDRWLPMYSPEICLIFAIASIEDKKLGEWFTKPDIIARFTSEDERRASTIIVQYSRKSDLKQEAEKLNRIPLEFLGGSKARVIVTQHGGVEGEVEGVPVVSLDHFFDEDFFGSLIRGDTKSILRTIRNRQKIQANVRKYHYRP